VSEVPAATGRVARTVLWNAAGQLLGVVHQLVLVPVFLRAWGEGTYGDWLAATAVAGYLSLSNMGVQNYAVNRMMQERARGDDAALRRSMAATWGLYARIVGGGALVVALIGMLLPWSSWFDGHEMPASVARSVAVVSGVGVLLGVGTGFVTATHRIFDDAPRWSFQDTLVRFGTLVFTILFLAAGLGPVPLSVALVVLQVVAIGGFLTDAVRRNPVVRPSGAPDPAAMREFLVPSLLFLLLQVASGLTVQGTLIVASAALGGAAAAAFATVRTLVNVVRQALQLVGNAVWPEFTRLGSDGGDGLARFHVLLVKVTCVIAASLVPAFVFAGPALHAAWTGGRASMDVPLLHWMLAGMAGAAPWLASSVVLVATNRHRGYALLGLVQGVLAISLAALLAPRLGTVALGMALTSTELVTFGVFVPYWAQRASGGRFSDYARDIYGPYVVVLGAALCAAWGAWAVTEGLTLPVRIAVPFVTSGTTAVLLSVLWFGPGERTFVRRLAGRGWSRLRPG